MPKNKNRSARIATHVDRESVLMWQVSGNGHVISRLLTSETLCGKRAENGWHYEFGQGAQELHEVPVENPGNCPKCQGALP